MYGNSGRPALIASALLLLFCGCAQQTDTAVPESPETTEASHGHSHGAGDELVWKVKEKISETGYEIWYGHHGTHFHAGESIEPAVAITQGGEAFADAKVFNSLVNPDDPAQVISDEVPTVYEPHTDEEIAHYAQGELTIPADADKCTIRFRVELPGHPEQTRDVTIDL